jgi:hypothetical protein
MTWLYWLDALFLVVLVTTVGWVACLARAFDRE